MANYAVTYQLCSSCVFKDESNDLTYHQFWTRFTKLLSDDFYASGNQTVYFPKPETKDPVAAATKFTDSIIAEFPNACKYIRHFFLVNLDENYNLIQHDCGCDDDPDSDSENDTD